MSLVYTLTPVQSMKMKESPSCLKSTNITDIRFSPAYVRFFFLNFRSNIITVHLPYPCSNHQLILSIGLSHFSLQHIQAYVLKKIPTSLHYVPSRPFGPAVTFSGKSDWCVKTLDICYFCQIFAPTSLTCLLPPLLPLSIPPPWVLLHHAPSIPPEVNAGMLHQSFHLHRASITWPQRLTWMDAGTPLRGLPAISPSAPPPL